MTSASTEAPLRRSALPDRLGLFTVVGAIGLPMRFIALLTMLGSGPGTSAGSSGGAAVVGLGPLATRVAGNGLLADGASAAGAATVAVPAVR